MKIFRFISMLLCTACVISFLGCQSERNKSAEAVLLDVIGALTLPSGSIYIYGASFGSENSLPSLTREVLYGAEESELAFSLLDDYAIYLSSFESPFEAAVFRCRAASDTDTLTALCLRRADTLNVLLKETAHASLSGNIRVLQKGRYVAMVLCDNPEVALRALKRALA